MVSKRSRTGNWVCDIFGVAILLGAINFAQAATVTYEGIANVVSVSNSNGYLPFSVAIGDEFRFRVTVDTSLAGVPDENPLADRLGGAVYEDAIQQIEILINGTAVPLPPTTFGPDSLNFVQIRNDVFISPIVPKQDQLFLYWRQPEIISNKEFQFTFDLEDNVDAVMLSSQEIPTTVDFGLATGWGIGFSVNNDSLGLSVIGFSVIQIPDLVVIDIKPGSTKNSINPRSKERLKVAILTTDHFDASTVDASTVQFGPDAAGPVWYRLDDVDHDGDWDLVLKFNTQETGVTCGDTEATLSGQTFDDIQITATDSIKTEGCKKVHKKLHKKKSKNTH